ncbi:MAG: hypothetical protein IPL83_10605 [Bdellovibrionales bacterium]|jgi:hypothetical protein|nr:hypothetical protein [Bdellovibrionales bacterium]
MKHVFTITALMLAANLASAMTVCSINTGSSKDLEFDQVLFSEEISSPRFLLVKNGARAVEEIQLSQFDTEEKWKAIDGATFVTFSIEKNGAYGITVGRVDISKSENILTLDAIAVGSVADQQFLGLTLPQKNLSLVCASSK